MQSGPIIFVLVPLHTSYQLSYLNTWASWGIVCHCLFSAVGCPHFGAFHATFQNSVTNRFADLQVGWHSEGRQLSAPSSYDDLIADNSYNFANQLANVATLCRERFSWLQCLCCKQLCHQGSVTVLYRISSHPVISEDNQRLSPGLSCNFLLNYITMRVTLSLYFCRWNQRRGWVPAACGPPSPNQYQTCRRVGSRYVELGSASPLLCSLLIARLLPVGVVSMDCSYQNLKCVQ